jgi:hypothetical protein
MQTLIILLALTTVAIPALTEAAAAAIDVFAFDELAAPAAGPYSITSSVRASSIGGTSRPSALAVLRLTTSSNLVGCCTGRSAGLVPLANAMAAVLLYRCPYTGMTVQQAFIAEDVPASVETFETVRCTACLNVHLVSRSGKVLSSDDTQGGNN